MNIKKIRYFINSSHNNFHVNILSLNKSLNYMLYKIDHIVNKIIIKKIINKNNDQINHIYKILRIIIFYLRNLQFQLNCLDKKNIFSTKEKYKINYTPNLSNILCKDELGRFCRIDGNRIIDYIYECFKHIESIKIQLKTYYQLDKYSREEIIQIMFFLDFFNLKIKKINVLLDRKFIKKRIVRK